MYILILFLLCMLFLSYYFCGKDFLAPSTILIIAFLISCFCALYNKAEWQFEISLFTVLLIGSCIFITFLMNLTFHYYYKNNTLIGHDYNIYQISDGVLFFGVLLLICCVLLRLYYFKQTVGNGNIIKMMAQYRSLTSYNNKNYFSYPVWVNQLFTFVTAFVYVSVFNLIYNFKKMTFKNIVLSIIIMFLWIILYLLTAARFEVMAMIVSWIYIFYTVRIKKHGFYKKMSIKNLTKLVLVILIVLYAFYLVKNIVGRDSQKNLIQYITSYMGTEIPNFDLFIKNPPDKSAIWGKETFFGLLQSLSKRGFVKIPYYTIHKEIRVLNGYSLGNVYTALRDYYYDFGVIGMLLMHTLFSFIQCKFYEKIKRKLLAKSILMYSTIYTCIPFYVFNNTLFATDFTFGYLIKIIEIYVLFDILIYRKIKIKNGLSKELRKNEFGKI